MSNTVNNYTETDLGNISLNPRGEYDDSADYEYLDTVSYQGGSYFCLAELETTITGIAPDAGHNSEHWQMIAAPGDMTPEYTTAYNDVINKAVQVETSRAAVELAQQEIEAVQTDVQQLHSDTVQTAQEAENSKNSAADSAQSAEQSRKTASESERNINGQIAGFDSRVSEAVEQSKEEINTTKQQAINTITNQQDASVNIVKTEGEKIITRVENDAKTVADDRATVEEAAQTVLNNAQEVAQNTQTVASNTENAAASAEGAKTSADNAAQSAKSVEDASKQIEQNKKDVDSLKEDLSNKITKFYASSQGETHITDSDNGKIQDMMVYGKSSQDGTPTPENPVEIKSVVNPTIKLFGSNILKIMDGEYKDGGVTVTVSNGVVKLKGTANRCLDIPLTANSKIAFKKGTKIIFSPNNVKGIENQNGSYLDFTNNNTVGFSITSNNINIPYIIKERDTKYSFILLIRCHAGITYDEIWKPQVLIGETITPFKPYTEQTITLPITLNAIPVSSGGNVTINGQQYVADYVDAERGKVVRKVDSSKLDNTQSIIDKTEWLLAEPQETDLTTEQITAFKALATYYPTTNISINSEQLDGYTVFNYPISLANGWNYVKQQLNDNRDYIYDMDLQSAEAYVNSEYAVALTELEV